ncbi:hypothetical protein Nepgr_005900 [Nepenthes gracilis]|uniref:Gamma-tubulin complex component n=1 Tax=Nepenthes gracilis TaxID=150966 RepID=A0AAD3S466_NEPGR|nr:hypothetical protein Nepgr_005900 [Nepenthes gracilis]
MLLLNSSNLHFSFSAIVISLFCWLILRAWGGSEVPRNLERGRKFPECLRRCRGVALPPPQTKKTPTTQMVETGNHQPPPGLAPPPVPQLPLGAPRGPFFPPQEQLLHLNYCIHSNPSWVQTCILAFQHYLVMLGTTVLIASSVVPLMGGDNGDKARVIQTLLFMSAVNTLLQTLLGSRLPTVMGPSFAFLIPIKSIINDYADQNFDSEHERFLHTLRTIQGSLIVSSFISIFLGYGKAWGNFTRFFSPVVIVPVVSVVGLGLFTRGFPQLANCVEIGLPMLILLVILQQYFKRLLPRFQFILERYALLFSIGIAWAFAAILTVAGAYNHVKQLTKQSCRTDSYLISSAPWIKIPYPFQWGPPIFRASDVFGMIGAALVSSAESTATFYAASRLAGATPPPAHVLSRSIGLQGISILIDGIFGAAVGTTASVENVGLLGLTRVGSRRVVQISTAFMIFFSIFGKFGAFFASIPLPIFAAIYCVLFGIVAAVGISFVQFTNNNSMRNLYVLGLTLFLGISIPYYFWSYTTSTSNGPVKTDGGWFNDILNTIFSSPTAVAMIVGALLDNTVEPGVAVNDRGVPWWLPFQNRKGEQRNEEFYSLPLYINDWQILSPQIRMMDGSISFIERIHNDFSNGLHFMTPMASLRANEFDLVRGVLQILQGNCSSLFYWDQISRHFHAKAGIYVTHLSLSSLHVILNQFLYAATCLRLVEDVVNKIKASLTSPPTLRAFANSVSTWLKRLRDIALKEEVKISKSDSRTSPTLLGIVSTLSSLCSGAEYLLQIVHEAIPQAYLESISCIPAAEVAVHILDYLYQKLHEVCLVRCGEEEAYLMLLYLFVGSALPYIESLDSWLYDGILHDPYNEMFFYLNKEVSINDAEFWEQSFLLRFPSQPKLDTELSGVTSEKNNEDPHACPLFIKDIANAIVSTGKSLQLIRHVPMASISTSSEEGIKKIDGFGSPSEGIDLGDAHQEYSIEGVTLPEAFCVSILGLLGDGDHAFNSFCQDDFHAMIVHSLESKVEGQKFHEGDGERFPTLVSSGKTWFKFLSDTLWERHSTRKDENISSHVNEYTVTGLADNLPIMRSFCPENPVITVSKMFLNKNKDAWGALNLSKNLHLPPLNDEGLREVIFNDKGGTGMASSAKGTNYVFGFQFSESEYLRSQGDTNVLETLFPFPVILPSFQDDLNVSELLPFQKNSTLSSRILSWIEVAEPKATPLPTVIVQECLIFFIKKQMDCIGSHMLTKLLKEWRLIDELGVLRDIYLLGSGDLLQHFLTVIFNRLDKGESWDDDFELNMILQESIRNSADCMLLSAPDSLVVSISKLHGFDGSYQPHKSHDHSLGIHGLDALNFTYKVSWPLELIANMEAIKKYNQVMHFLLKVKHAKFVLDKARRWMWKGRGTVAINCKHHWLVEQKLLHFVDAFHQYVMDRVYHSAWHELCKGMSAARSLDDAIAVHEAYLLSIQRQCFVAPDKLGALIASRINSVLGLAPDFYTIQLTINSGAAISAIKARCEMEIDRIERQFDDCVAFLLRVLSFKLNVGHFPHLADLVTRINYNYYYMSDSGNMITAPGS